MSAGAHRRQALGQSLGWGLTLATAGVPGVLGLSGVRSARARERSSDASAIRLGVVLDQSGIGRVNGLDLLAGSRALVARVNREGGVHGQALALVAADDAFDPAQTRARTLELVRDPGVLALLHPLGTGPTAAMAEAAPDVPIVGPSTGTLALRQAGLPQVFWTRASYAREIDKLLQTAHTLSMQRVALVFPQDALGASLREAFQQGCARHGLQAVAQAATPGTESPDVAGAAQALAQARPQLVVVGLAGTTAAFVRAYRALDRAASLYGLSIGASAGSLQSMGPWARGMGFSVVVPAPTAGKYALVRAYQADLLASRQTVGTTASPSGDAATAANAATLSIFGVEGYLAAAVAVEGLRRAGPAPTRSGLLAALQGLKSQDFGGVSIGFGPGQRQGSDYVSVAVVMPDGRLAM